MSERKRRPDARQRLIDEMAEELMILRAAWIIAGDDDRRRKALSVGPGDVRRWSALIRRAGRAAAPAEQGGAE